MSENNNQSDKEAILKNNFVMWDAINGDFYEHESLGTILKDLKENYCDPEEGIHPDIETIQIFIEVADVVVEPVDGEDTHRVKVIPRDYFNQLTLLQSSNEELKAKISTYHDVAIENKEQQKQIEELRKDFNRIHENLILGNYEEANRIALEQLKSQPPIEG